MLLKTINFLSGLFTRSKRDESKRMILNLKRLNKFVDYKSFKMESLQNVLELIRQGIYIASIDLKDDFYSLPVHKNHQGYLAFFVEEYLKFVCMPNGYEPTIQIFTKMSKISFSILKEKGFLAVVYVGDSYLQGDDFENCLSNVLNTIEILRSLGSKIYPDKSKFMPAQCITHLFRIYFKLCQNANCFNSGKKKIF